MAKLFKPFEGAPEYYCFGCSPSNPIGLNLEFEENDDFVIANWNPKPEFQGFKNVLHGGIQSTLMDEIAAWCVNIKVGTAGVTQDLNVKFHKAVYTNTGTIKLKSHLIKLEKNIAFIHVGLYNKEEVLCSEGEFKYFTYPEPIAKKKLFYPGKDAFYKPSNFIDNK